MHNAASVAATIKASLESNEPDAILNALGPYAGKNITTRLEKVLPEGWSLQRFYGWTQLVNDEYRRQSGNRGIRLILARTEASVPLDLAFVESENPAYFAGRRERNADRLAALSNLPRLTALADAMNAVEEAEAKLAAAKHQYDETIEGAGFAYALTKTLKGAA
jgi:hypothetical protein